MYERSLLRLAATSAFVSAIAIGCGSNSNGGAVATSGTPDGSAAADGSGEELGVATGDTSDGGGQDATANDGPATVAETGTTQDAGLTCVPPVDGDSCDACTAANCCAMLAACANEPADDGATACEDISDCMDNCENPQDGGDPPPDCLGVCTQPYGSDQAVTDYNNLASCQQTLCPNDC